MEDAASLGGRSLSADTVSNASTALLSESGASPGDSCEVADVERHKEEGTEHELRGDSGHEKSESRFSGQLSARATPQDLTEATSKDQRGGTPQEQRGGTPQEQRGGTPQEQRGGTPQEQRGGTPQEQRGGTPQEQRGGTPQEQRGGTPQEQRGGTPQEQRGGTPQEQRGGTPQDQRGGTPQEQRGGTPQEQKGGTPQEQRGGTPQEQRGGTPQEQRGGTPQEQRGGTPQEQRGGTPQEQRGGTPQEQRGGTPQEQRGGTPQEQRGGTPQEQRGGTPQEQRGGTPQEQRGGTPQEQRGGTPQEQRGGTPQEQRGGTPQEQRGGTPQEQRGGTPQEQRGGTPQEQRGGTPQEQRGGTPTDQTISGDDTTGCKSVSPDVKPEDRPSTQNSFTDVNRNIQSQQEKPIQDGVSGKQSPEERLSLSRQSQFEDATSENNEVQDIDVRSADGASLNTTESQRHISTGSVTGCCCDQSSEPTKEETDAESPKGEIVATPTVSETAESVASLERGSDSRATNQSEPSLEEVGDSSCSTQPKYEELGGQEREVLEQCCQQKAVEEVLNVQSPEGEHQLKAEINSLQTRLETLIKDNNEKGMRIVALESNLLEMTAKLVNVEKKCLPLETSPSRREASKSRTCAIL